MRISVAVLLALLGAATLAAQQSAPQTAASGAAQPTPQAAPQLPGEPPPPTFRVEVNYVEVDAVVTDAQGNPVTDLSIDDFEVREDGRPQKISAFSTINLPIERAERPLFADAPIEPDVRTNTGTEGRIYMIVLDDLHTTFTTTPRVKSALRRFIEQDFGTNDLAAVVFTSGGQQGTEFTNSRRQLLAAIDRFSGRNLEPEALAIAAALGNRPPEDFRSSPRGSGAANPSNLSGIPGDPLEQERAYNARTSLTQIRKLAEFMEGIRGRRKTLLLISEGISYDIYDVFSNSSAGLINDLAKDAAAAATRANVSIFAIDPRGLTAFDELIQVPGSVPADISPSDFNLTSRLQDSLRIAQQSLQVLANETGGFAAVNRNDFAGAFARVVRENSSYYVLGYYPANDRRDGRFRRLEVRVKRPGVQVRARRGYVAPRGRAPQPTPAVAADGTRLAPAASAALSSPIPTGGIPLKLFAAPFKGTAPNAAVVLALEMAVTDFKFAERNNVFSDRVEVVFTAIDAKGTIRPGDRHTLSLDLRPETLAATRERGLRVVSEILLPPGRYQLRAAAAEDGASRTASVLYDLEVPDFYAPGLSMSGLALSSALASSGPTVKPKDPLATVLTGPPATLRDFDRRDTIALFAEFYENLRNAPPHMVDVSATLRDATGRVVFEHREERASADLQGATGGYGYGLQIPLREIEAGTYVLRVEGRSRAENGQTVNREVLIRIR
jgi:VWFA-related protein